MAEGGEQGPPAGGESDAGDWKASDLELKRRLVRDEVRLARDEARIAEEEREIRRNWWLALALGGLLILTIAALAISVFALNRDIEAVAKAAPKDDSVGASALQDGAVGPNQIADGAVVTPKLGVGAVGTGRIADAAVTGRKVAPDSLTAAQIDEATLTVGQADRAGDAAQLGDVAAAQYLRDTTTVRAETRSSTLAVKGPLSASCPSGTAVVAGGAEIDGAARVAITTSAADGAGAWVARAAAIDTPSSPWRLVVTAVCAVGG